MEWKSEADFANRFHEALGDGMIRAWFQPVFRSLTQQIMGAEALARWFDPDGTMLSPADFIPQLEQSGLIFELDMEIIRQACALYDELRTRGTPLSRVSVNLSRLDFARKDLFEQVCSVLDAYSVPHEAINLEITESVMLEDTETFEKTFSRFRDAGFFVWLDDFGSGYSSLNVLQNYPFDVIKFDMLFLRKMSAKGKNMLASLISMAKTLGIHTLTEGVETTEQREFLLDVGCEAQQGFYYARPLSKEALIEEIERKPGILEKKEDEAYWDQIGRLNFVNPNPLKEYAERWKSTPDDYVSSYDASIALIECGKDQFSYIYATEGYKERLRELGFSSVDGLENALTSHQRGHYYLVIQKLVMDALQQGTVQTVEYAYRDVYYRLSALFIARREGRAMILMRLNTFDAEREVKTAKEMLDNSSALFSTYELVVMIWPERKKAKRIHTASSIPSYDREETIEKSVIKFCENQVDPLDRERYMRFLDFRTLAERIGNSSQQFIQGLFRMRLGQEQSRWYTARVTQVPSNSEQTFILTVQNIQGALNHQMDVIAEEHPEFL
jgi:EAL domain-containing protein (putative c-di-GMP-specific phosphodiesterase class I)